MLGPVTADGDMKLRLQDSNLGLTAPKAVVLPLHQGGSRLTGAGQVCQTSPNGPRAAGARRASVAAGRRLSRDATDPHAPPAIMNA